MSFRLQRSGMEKSLNKTRDFSTLLEMTKYNFIMLSACLRQVNFPLLHSSILPLFSFRFSAYLYSPGTMDNSNEIPLSIDVVKYKCQTFPIHALILSIKSWKIKFYPCFPLIHLSDIVYRISSLYTLVIQYLWCIYVVCIIDEFFKILSDSEIHWLTRTIICSSGEWSGKCRCISD